MCRYFCGGCVCPCALVNAKTALELCRLHAHAKKKEEKRKRKTNRICATARVQSQTSCPAMTTARRCGEATQAEHAEQKNETSSSIDSLTTIARLRTHTVYKMLWGHSGEHTHFTRLSSLDAENVLRVWKGKSEKAVSWARKNKRLERTTDVLGGALVARAARERVGKVSCCPSEAACVSQSAEQWWIEHERSTDAGRSEMGATVSKRRCRIRVVRRHFRSAHDGAGCTKREDGHLPVRHEHHLARRVCVVAVVHKARHVAALGRVHVVRLCCGWEFG